MSSNLLQTKSKRVQRLFAATVLGYLLQEESVKSSATFALAVHQVTELSMKKKLVGRVAFQKLWDIVLELVTYTNDFTLIADGLDECSINYYNI
jgi:hypothetical protein